MADQAAAGRDPSVYLFGGSTMTLDTNAIDVSDMFAVHQALRDSLSAAPRLVAGIDADDEARSALVSSFYDNVIAFLHAHHEGEEALIFPLLRERCPGQLEMIDTVAAQHRDVDELVTKSVELLEGWSAGDAAAKDGCAQSLGALGQRMREHLDDEEQQLLPLCATNLTEQEWGALPGHALGSFTGDKVWLILGLIREHMTDEHRAEMLAHMPPPAAEMWTTIGEKSYIEMMDEV